MGWRGVVCLLAVGLLASAQLSAAACPALTVNFFPEGTKNVPAGWTREAQVAAGNEDTSSLNTIKLTASPAPKLFVQPVHPLFSRKACVPADCLPSSKGRRLQQAQPSRSSSSSDSSHKQQQQQQPGDAGSSSSSKGLGAALWNRLQHSFTRAAAPSSSTWVPPSSEITQVGSGSQQEQFEAAGVDTGDLPDSSSSSKLTDDSGSGSSARKGLIAAGGGLSGSSGSNERTGWTDWSGDEDAWWSGEDRNLQACSTTVAQPASYDILWNLDGGVAKKATMPKEGAPFIVLSNLDTLAPGKHTLYVKATMIKGTAEVNGVPSLQPPADQVYSGKVVFTLVDGKGDAEEAVEPSADKAAAAKGKAPAAANATEPAAAAGNKTEAVNGKGEAEPAEAPAPAKAEAPAETEKPAAPAELPAMSSVNATVSAQAVKYYCMRQYNVGGKIHSQKTVPAGDEGVNQCAVACNALGQDCSGFGLSANKCYLMKLFNTSSSAADATLDALCMKSANDWLDFGTQTTGNRVGTGFFCLRGYDIKGDPAGTGDAENPVKAANTEIPGMTPSTCATQCKSTAGCQFFIMNKPTISGGTATCYLKMHALGGLYGSTGPSKETVEFSCFNGQEAWMTFGGQLDYAVPSPEVNTGVQTPALAAVGPATGSPVGPSGAKSYRCIKGYNVSGTAASTVQVSMGDEGLSQCAANCDKDPNCIAYSMAETGLCSLLSALNFNSTGPSPRTYGMCFGDVKDWNRLGNPDANGMFCIKNYDFAGDGVRMVDYITITSGAGAIQFCKQQCASEPQCQFSVATLGKCYMKQNILSGSAGTTRPDTAVDASCVKGEQNWALAALQVSAAPERPVGGRGLGNVTLRSVPSNSGPRKTTLRSAAGSTQCSWVALWLSSGVLAVVLSLCFMP